MSSFIDEVLEDTKELDTPKSYLYWSCLATIAAVTNDNTSVSRGTRGRVAYNLCPNLYVMLFGPSGLGKGYPCALAKSLVTATKNNRVISGRQSIEGLIKKLSTAKTQENGPIIKTAKAFIIQGEFANLLIRSPDALTILTEWYDTHWLSDWENSLKHSDIERLVRPNITLLGGSSVEHFNDAVPEVNQRGGFVGRLITVYETKRSQINPLFPETESEQNEEMEDDSIKAITEKQLPFLTEISKVKGKFRYSQAALDLLRTWEAEWRSSAEDMVDSTGGKNRVPDNVVKVAMCLSLSRRTSLIIDEVDAAESIKQVQDLYFKSKTALQPTADKSPVAQVMNTIIVMLATAPLYTIRREKLLQDGWRLGMYGQNLTIAIQTLVQGGMIKVVQEEGKTFYRLTPEAVRIATGKNGSGVEK